MSISIRPFKYEQADYEHLLRIDETVYTEYPKTVEMIQHRDKNRDPKIKLGRYILELDGRPVGLGLYGQSEWMYHPQKFHMGLVVEPEHQGKGFGKALWAHVREDLAQYDPISIRAGAREDWVRSIRFLEERGFERSMSDWESRLDPKGVDMAGWQPALDRVETAGIEIRPLSQDKLTPELKRKIYDAIIEMEADVPSPEPQTMQEYDQWSKNHYESPNFDPETQFFAWEGDEIVGYSALWKDGKTDVLWTGLTGVRRPWRKQGIATALKLHAVKYAQDIDCPRIHTWNEQNNRGMLGINERLGYVKQPAWVGFVLKLREE